MLPQALGQDISELRLGVNEHRLVDVAGVCRMNKDSVLAHEALWYEANDPT